MLGFVLIGVGIMKDMKRWLRIAASVVAIAKSVASIIENIKKK